MEGSRPWATLGKNQCARIAYLDVRASLLPAGPTGGAPLLRSWVHCRAPDGALPARDRTRAGSRAPDARALPDRGPGGQRGGAPTERPSQTNDPLGGGRGLPCFKPRHLRGCSASPRPPTGRPKCEPFLLPLCPPFSFSLTERPFVAGAGSGDLARPDQVGPRGTPDFSDLTSPLPLLR